MRKYYKFQEKPEHIEHILTEIEDNLVPYDSKGDIVIDRDIHCRSIYIEGDSLYINGVKVESPKFNDDGSQLKYNWAERKFEYTPLNVENVVGALPSVSAKTGAYTAVFYDFLLCDGTFTVTLPNILSADIGKKVTVCNTGTGIITVECDGADTIYDETDMECIPNGTFVFMATTTSTWVLT